MKKGLINIEAMYNLQMSEFCEHQRLQISQNEMYAKCLECGALLKYQLNKLINFNQMSNKQYIVLPGGKECKLVNPNCATDPVLSTSAQYLQRIKNLYDAFEATNPILALTEVMPEGETFSGEPIERYRAYHSNMWHILDKSNIHWKDVIVLSDIRCENNGVFYEYQLAIKPLKAIEPVNDNEIWKPDNVGSNPNECIFPTCTKDNCRCLNKPIVDVVENKETVEEAEARLYRDYHVTQVTVKREAFKAGAERNAQTKQSKVVEVIEDLKHKYDGSDKDNWTDGWCAALNELTDLLTKLKQ